MRGKGGTERAYPVDFLLHGFPVLYNGNINLIVLVLFIRPRCVLLIPLLVLVGQVLAGDEQREGGNDRAGADDSEWDLIPWLVLRLPDERSGSVTNRVADQDHGVDSDALCMTGR